MGNVEECRFCNNAAAVEIGPLVKKECFLVQETKKNGWLRGKVLAFHSGGHAIESQLVRYPSVSGLFLAQSVALLVGHSWEF